MVITPIGAGGTGGFKKNPCTSFEDRNFFNSGVYKSDSYSCSWATKDSPDDEGLTTPVYELILNKFNIPFTIEGVGPFKGTLAGMDIRNMDAIQALRLSLSESLIEKQWWELYEDADGGVFFSRVFDNGLPGKTVTLDIRVCVPSVSVDNEVDMVIVRGYDPPPCRIIREPRDVVPRGGKVLGTDTKLESIVDKDDAFIIDTLESFGDLPCHQGVLKNSVQKSYRDPLDKVSEFGPQEPNPFYDVKAFEQLLGYVHIVDGMPTSPDEAARVKYSFSDTTILYIPIDFPAFSPATLSARCTANLPQGAGITYFQGSFTVNTPQYTDRYGYPWPFVLKPYRLLCTANQIENIVDISAALGNNPTAVVYVNPVKQLLSLSEGSSWIYSLNNASSFDLDLFYQPKFDAETWAAVLEATSLSVQIKYSDGRSFSTGKLEQYPNFGGSAKILGSPNNLGHLIDRLYLAVICDRPSVIVEDSLGEAKDFAQKLRIQYAPIVLEDRPAPVAYRHITAGIVEVDQSVGLPDSDPTTCQDFDSTPMQVMQDLQQGNVHDLTLPFCKDETDCAKVADTLFEYMTHNGTQTYVLTCGPDDEPELGAAVSGFPQDKLRIENISYSYNDGNAYTIEVTLGPVFTNVGSFNNGAWVRKTENISRKAIIRWVAGDGANYRVLVQGLGEYNAINGTDFIFNVGETVTVEIRNNPTEV